MKLTVPVPTRLNTASGILKYIRNTATVEQLTQQLGHELCQECVLHRLHKCELQLLHIIK